MIVVATTEAEVRRVTARVSELGAVSVDVMSPGADRRLVLASVDDARHAERVTRILRDGSDIAVVRPDGGPQLDGWLEHTRPRVFGDRLSVCFAWSEHDRSGREGLIELGLGGFGSGEHVTTRLIIEQLIERIVGGERVLDVGCGSGILGLCAVRLGATQVTGVDLKVEAVEATRRNAELNAMADRIDATVASLDELDGPFDVIVANVARSAAVELAPQLARLTAPGGWLAVSGISPPQCDLVAGFLRPLLEVDRVTSGEWSALIVAHPPTGLE